MLVGVGYSENPDTEATAVEATTAAMIQTGQADPCDLVLLFSTARHDARVLHDSVVALVGKTPKIVGGGCCRGDDQ